MKRRHGRAGDTQARPCDVPVPPPPDSETLGQARQEGGWHRWERAQLPGRSPGPQLANHLPAGQRRRPCLDLGISRYADP